MLLKKYQLCNGFLGWQNFKFSCHKYLSSFKTAQPLENSKKLFVEISEDYKGVWCRQFKHMS